jgi:hypothetical protein
MAFRTFTFLCLAVSLFACGPSSTQPTGGNDAGAAQDAAQVPASGPIPESVGPLAIAQAICNKVAQCGCDWSTAATCLNDQVCSAATCVSGYTNLYQEADMGAAQAGEVYDPQGARQCIDAIAAASCLDVDYTNLCTVTWNGTVAIGQPCSATQACETSDAAPAVCSASGTCVADTTASQSNVGVAMGGACDGNCLGSTCNITAGMPGGQCQHAQGLACVGGTCEPLEKQGDTCTGMFACADPLTCIGGACTIRLSNGSACLPPSGDNPCAVGSGCVSFVCATLKPNGQPCQDASECLENRCFAGQCIPEFASPLCGE